MNVGDYSFNCVFGCRGIMVSRHINLKYGELSLL